MSGATCSLTRGRGDHVAGFVEPNGTVTFALGEVYYDYYYDFLGQRGQHDLVEQFSDSSVYIAEGIVTATVTPAGISGTLSGEVAVGRGLVAPFSTLLGSCYADAHRYDMTRR